MHRIAQGFVPIFGKTEKEKLLAVVNEYHDPFERIDQILDTMPEVLDVVHQDIVAGLCKETVKSRKATFTTENLCVSSFSCSPKVGPSGNHRDT